MARPIRETPILTGTDAKRFVSEMKKVEKLSKETRSDNRKSLMNEFEKISKKITIFFYL